MYLRREGTMYMYILYFEQVGKGSAPRDAQKGRGAGRLRLPSRLDLLGRFAVGHQWVAWR